MSVVDPKGPAASTKPVTNPITKAVTKPVSKTVTKPTTNLVTKAQTQLVEGKGLLSKQDCFACHKPDVKVVGPSYQAIAQRYKSTDANVNKLAAKIIAGGMGNWGQVPMTPHAALSLSDAEKIVRYILSTGK